WDGPVRLAGGGGLVLSGRLGGSGVLPGSGLVEAVLRAGDEVGCGVIQDLMAVAPLARPAQVQVRVDDPDAADTDDGAAAGARAVSVWSPGPDGAWVLHATGTLRKDDGDTPTEGLTEWPPPGAERLDAEGPERLAAWRSEDGTMFAEVALASDSGAERHLLHHDLLDAVAPLLGGPAAAMVGWHDVRLFATGADLVRVRMIPVQASDSDSDSDPDSGSDHGARYSLLVTDDVGAPVATVGAVELADRPEWSAIPAAEGTAGPDTESPQTRQGGTERPRAAARRVQRSDGTESALDAADLLDLVRTEAARVLGHDTGDEIDTETGFLEIGFDSLTGAELRTRLSAATGRDLPPTLIFDHPTIAALAAYLAERTGEAEGAPEPGGIGALYWQAAADGKFTAALDLVKAAAALRPSFGAAEAERHVPEAVRLTPGADGNGPVVLCLPGFSAVSGPHEYGRFAAALRDRLEVWALPEPGYREGELLPESLAALVRLQSEAVRRCADGRPYVLLGRSASGMLAHAVAEHLEADGDTPAGALLLDSYSPDVVRERPWLETTLTKAVADREAGFALRDDGRLSAMGRYHQLFSGWRPEPLAAPTVLVRAEEPYSPELDDPRYAEWRASWVTPHIEIDVPGNHFTILESRSESTADAVHAWLARTI
ncbi:thioesterase domain-containing protein, partial [Nocardiopsis listeri]|uniref:thioesterase domain-containing protein n=1 Tax=Nocardiopsis listeri TaxID=53440 RepID=UPI000B0623F0